MTTITKMLFAICLSFLCSVYLVQAALDTSFDGQCTGPIALVTAFNHPRVVLVNKPVRYRNYRKICRFNGYEPLTVRDDRELRRVLKELKSLHCHNGPVWIEKYWKCEQIHASRRSSPALVTRHGGMVEIYPQSNSIRYPALCRNKRILKSHKKKRCSKSKKCRKSGKTARCKRTKRQLIDKPAKCL